MRYIAKTICLMLISMNLYANVAINEIDSALKTKTNTEIANHKDHQVNQALDDYYFVFFYRSTCPHCHKFAPILKDFANFYHIKVIAYSTDGKDLDGFNGQQMQAQQYQDYFLAGGYKAVVPALYLQNKYTDQVYPVLFGEAEPYQLAERMNSLLKHIKEQSDV